MRTPNTIAEAAATRAPDEVRSDDRYRWGWYDGSHQTLLVVGIDVDPILAASTGQVTPEGRIGQWVEQRRRDELARAREYKTRPKTVSQIRAEVAYSWARAEREIAAKYGLRVVA